MPGTKWITGDTITFARMNQKTLIVQAAEPAVLYVGMCWFDIDDGMSYQRNAANNAWYTGLTEELAYTITGLHTYDLGANPPFAVDAASTKVANLDVDKVDGVDLPATIVEVLSDHDKADHDALNIDADTLDAFHATSFPRLRDTQKNLELTTTNETEICAYTIDGTDRIMRVATFFRVITGATIVTVTVKYTNILAAGVTCTLVDAKTLAIGDYTYAPLIFEIDASTEITLNITASVANRVFASGTIEELV